jgi:hypothetical protein
VLQLHQCRLQNKHLEATTTTVQTMLYSLSSNKQFLSVNRMQFDESSPEFDVKHAPLGDTEQTLRQIYNMH